MGVFLVKRILSVIPILLLAVLILTGLIHLSPVDPAQAYLSAAHIQPTDELLAANEQNSDSINRSTNNTSMPSSAWRSSISAHRIFPETGPRRCLASAYHRRSSWQ